jgi:hypothetical protein
MKKCGKCGAEKELTDFYEASMGRGYLQSECKECTKTRSRTRVHGPRRVEILAKSRTYAQGKRARVREATFAAYGGNVCACCGETESKFLTLDHMNNDGAAFRKAVYRKNKRGNTAGYHTYYWLARNGFPSGFQVLCMNCNYGKRMNDGVCPHKTKRNDYPLVGVEPSGSKRIAPVLKIVQTG